ncbi:MAG: hypothetical protein Q8L10_04715 [Candidatus Moranbacteria bacterium]|nr:hypothetical protein [Candidatus Moranbacteria bacterium]
MMGRESKIAQKVELPAENIEEVYTGLRKKIDPGKFRDNPELLLKASRLELRLIDLYDEKIGNDEKMKRIKKFQTNAEMADFLDEADKDKVADGKSAEAGGVPGASRRGLERLEAAGLFQDPEEDVAGLSGKGENISTGDPDEEKAESINNIMQTQGEAEKETGFSEEEKALLAVYGKHAEKFRQRLETGVRWDEYADEEKRLTLEIQTAVFLRESMRQDGYFDGKIDSAASEAYAGMADDESGQ